MMKYTVEHIVNRLAHLRQKPVENAALIRKWERILRKAQEN